jgi:hypothetical protein
MRSRYGSPGVDGLQAGQGERAARQQLRNPLINFSFRVRNSELNPANLRHKADRAPREAQRLLARYRSLDFSI